MIKPRLVTSIVLLLMLTASPLSISSAATAATKTKVTDQAAFKRLKGTHYLALQWISWEQFGTAVVTEKNGLLHIKGSQTLGPDSLTIDGDITAVSTRSFSFDGRIVSQSTIVNGGEPCERNGKYTFAVKGSRKYWRLQQQDNCEKGDAVVDYIDVFFAGPKS